MLVKTYASAVQGIKALTVTIEVDISAGINFFMVGLPDPAVKESQHRIASALHANGLEPKKKRTVINLAPADIRKEGAAYDLPLAIGMLAASEHLPADRIAEYMIMGELSLDGKLKGIRGTLAMAEHARDEGFRGILLPLANADEAAVIEGLEVYGMKNIREVVDFFHGRYPHGPVEFHPDFFADPALPVSGEDLSDVRGQTKVKRALEIAAAGNHSLLMIGPPGSGKTMLAKRLPGILPPLTLEEALETTKLHSVAGKLNHETGIMRSRPFRDPHHTISDVALVGGGAWPQPGEISLAHNGVLFLDELPEYKRNVLEVLRQPMEGRVMRISRAKFNITFPACFMLVAAMNPCPCGYYNHPVKACECLPPDVKQYLSRISGPLLDRIDIQIEVTPVPFHDLADTSGSSSAETSAVIRDRVIRARKIQEIRYKEQAGVHNNAQVSASQMKACCQTNAAGASLLKNAMEYLQLSARAYDRILKVARTIADLEGSAAIQSHHLAEAINYRSLDRNSWGE